MHRSAAQVQVSRPVIHDAVSYSKVSIRSWRRISADVSLPKALNTSIPRRQDLPFDTLCYSGHRSTHAHESVRWLVQNARLNDLSLRGSASIFQEMPALDDDLALASTKNHVVQFSVCCPPTCSLTTLANRRALSISSKALASTRPKKSTRGAIRPVHPVWWLAPSPAPLSPWKYS